MPGATVPDIFVVPDPSGFISGGNRFNAELIAALRSRGRPISIATVAGTESVLVSRAAGMCVVDSLLLRDVKRLRACAGGAAIVLLLHYLPSLVAHGSDWTPDCLGPDEADALAQASALIVPSAWMAETLTPLARGGPILIVEPGASGVPAATRDAEDGVHALMIAPLAEGKRVAPFLRALADRIEPTDRVDLRVIGRDEDPAYAHRCRALVENGPLAGRVRLLSSLPHEHCMRELSTSNLLVSASRMESFGLALAEARQAGVPILATAGGAVARLVSPEAGGQLTNDVPSAAAALLALARDPTEHGRRLERARAQMPAERSWSDVAADYERATASLRIR